MIKKRQEALSQKLLEGLEEKTGDTILELKSVFANSEIKKPTEVEMNLFAEDDAVNVEEETRFEKKKAVKGSKPRKNSSKELCWFK